MTHVKRQSTTRSSPCGAAALAVAIRHSVGALAVWAIFLLVLCLLRGMLLILFLTFMVCYLALTIIGGLARRFWPNHRRAWLERLLAVGFLQLCFSLWRRLCTGSARWSSTSASSCLRGPRISIRIMSSTVC